MHIMFVDYGDLCQAFDPLVLLSSLLVGGGVYRCSVSGLNYPIEEAKY